MLLLNLFEPGTDVTIQQANVNYILFHPRPKKEKLVERAFKYCAPTLYNKIPTEKVQKM